MNDETFLITLGYLVQPVLIAVATYFAARFWLNKSKQRLTTFKSVSLGVGFTLGILFIVRTGEELEQAGYLFFGIVVCLVITPVIVIAATAFLGWLIAQIVFLWRLGSQWVNRLYNDLPD